MHIRRPRVLSRRLFLARGLAVPAAFILAACGSRSFDDVLAQLNGPTLSAQNLPPTPACGDDDDPTPPQTAGPFYTPNSPQRASLLEPGIVGTPMILTGRVLTTDCRPVAGALLDFWHADDSGVYDNEGYRLRGHQFADTDGRYTLETIVPGLYPGRTRHFHVNVQPPNGAVLTTQLYFPDEPANVRDGIFDPALLMVVHPGAAPLAAAFDFVLA